MQYINLSVGTLQSEQFLGADPVERATWLCLLRYCAVKDNGGTILACRDWPDRKWQQVCGVTKAEVMTDSRLWSWIGEGSIVVWEYPLAQQEQYLRIKAIAKKAADKRWKNREANIETPPKPRKKK